MTAAGAGDKVGRVSAWTLAPGEVHVWLTEAERLLDATWWAGALALMTEDERARHDRFVFERSRRQFAAARALVRRVLAGYVGAPPEALRFVVSAHGRPALTPDAGGLVFNLSHTEGLAALAVARGVELGVDVEDCQRRSRPEEIADHFFAAAEVAGLMALPAAARPARFFDLWTLKEAYIKARGLGLALPLGGFAFDLAGGRAAIAVSFEERIGDAPAGWRFTLDDPTPRHRLALAFRGPGGGEPRVRARWVDPVGAGLWQPRAPEPQPPF